MSKRLSSETRLAIVRRVLAGEAVGRVAKRYGISRETVRYWQKVYDPQSETFATAKSRRNRRAFARPIITAICALRRWRWPYGDIAKFLHLGRGSVERVCKREGVLAITSFRDNQRKYIETMCSIDNMSHADIADALGVPEEALDMSCGLCQKHQKITVELRPGVTTVYGYDGEQLWPPPANRPIYLKG